MVRILEIDDVHLRSRSGNFPYSHTKSSEELIDMVKDHAATAPAIIAAAAEQDGISIRKHLSENVAIEITPYTVTICIAHGVNVEIGKFTFLIPCTTGTHSLPESSSSPASFIGSEYPASW